MIGPGQVVAHRFSVISHAGTGGMGTVYLAQDQQTGGRVALKVLRSESSDRDGQRRFAHEVDVIGGIDHPGIVRYVAHGVTDEGQPYLAMEWIEGSSLADRLAETPPPSFAETTAFGAAVAAALAACHELGVVHRDLKPSNVMLRGRDIEIPQLVDFGLARLSSNASLTVSGTLLGTPRFMAPEQIRDARRVDGRADVFSLGCVLFECATNRAAFRADDAMAVMVKILLERAPRVREVCPTVPKALARWIDAALEPECEARPTAAAMAKALAELDLLDQGPLSAPFDPSVLKPMSAAPSLGVEPIEVTTLDGPVEWPLPRPTGAFFGRVSILERIDALLDRERVTASIWGPPGIGKTRLVLEALERRRPKEPTLTPLFCELRNVRTRAELSREIARTLGLAPDPDPAAAERAVTRALQARPRSLLVLDAVDHLAPELGDFRSAIAARAPMTRLVLTSRERLELEGVERLEVGPLSSGSRPAEGVAMFIERARAVLGSAASLDEDAVGEIVSAVSAIPLAIELAAGRIDVLGLEGLRARAPLREANDGHLSGAMRDAIVDSFEQLDDRSRRALSLFAVFPAPFSVAAAEAVIESDAEDTIARLRRKAFLSTATSEPGAEARVWMLAPIRAFALLQLMPVDRRAALDRHARFFARRAADSIALLDRTGSLDAQKRLDADQAHFQLAIEHTLAGEVTDVEQAVTLLGALEPILSANGANDELVTLIERVLSQCHGELPARLLRIRSRTFGACGRGADAMPALAQGIEGARRRGDAALGGLLLEMGVLQHTRGSLDEARGHYEEAIELLAAQGRERDEARALGNLGALRHDSGDVDGALALYREAVALLGAVGDLRLHGIFLGNLALLEQERGARDEARRHYEEAVAELEAYRDVRLLGVTLGNLAALDFEEGNVEAARARLERAQAFIARTADARSQALCLARLGAVLADGGRIDDAEVRFTRAERLVARRDPLAAKVVQALRAFGDLAHAAAAPAGSDARRRHLATAEMRLRAAEQAARDSDDLRTIARTLRPRLAAALQGDVG